MMVVPPLLKRAVSSALLLGGSPLGVGWFAVKTRTVRDEVSLPAMSATTRRTSWAPSGRAAVLKEKDPLAASGQGTTAVVRKAQDESVACADLWTTDRLSTTSDTVRKPPPSSVADQEVTGAPPTRPSSRK